LSGVFVFPAIVICAVMVRIPTTRAAGGTTIDSMNQAKMGSDMGKPMGSMNAEKMDVSRNKNMQNDMK
jgi:hypothetical protein